jgi:hypothetical protein
MNDYPDLFPFPLEDTVDSFEVALTAAHDPRQPAAKSRIALTSTGLL